MKFIVIINMKGIYYLLFSGQPWVEQVNTTKKQGSTTKKITNKGYPERNHAQWTKTKDYLNG